MAANPHQKPPQEVIPQDPPSEEHVRSLHELGAVFVPASWQQTRAGKWTKRPKYRGWNEEPPTLSRVLEHRDNMEFNSSGLLGIIPSSVGLAVLDIDSGDAGEVLAEYPPLIDHPSSRHPKRHAWYSDGGEPFRNGTWRMSGAEGDVASRDRWIVLWDAEAALGAALDVANGDGADYVFPENLRPAERPNRSGSAPDKVDQDASAKAEMLGLKWQSSQWDGPCPNPNCSADDDGFRMLSTGRVHCRKCTDGKHFSAGAKLRAIVDKLWLDHIGYRGVADRLVVSRAKPPTGHGKKTCPPARSTNGHGGHEKKVCPPSIKAAKQKKRVRNQCEPVQTKPVADSSPATAEHWDAPINTVDFLEKRVRQGGFGFGPPDPAELDQAEFERRFAGAREKISELNNFYAGKKRYLQEQVGKSKEGIGALQKVLAEWRKAERLAKMRLHWEVGCLVNEAQKKGVLVMQIVADFNEKGRGWSGRHVRRFKTLATRDWDFVSSHRSETQAMKAIKIDEMDDEERQEAEHREAMIEQEKSVRKQARKIVNTAGLDQLISLIDFMDGPTRSGNLEEENIRLRRELESQRRLALALSRELEQKEASQINGTMNHSEDLGAWCSDMEAS